MGKLNRRNFCQCPCHGIAKSGNRFINGHNMRKPKSEEHKQNLRKPKSEEGRKNIKIAQNKSEVNAKRSQSLKIAYAKPEVIEKCMLSNARPEVKEQRSRSAKIAMNKQETRDQCSRSAIIAWTKLEVREKRKQSLKIAYAKPEVKERRSQSATKLWQSPDFVKKQMKARNVKQNKTEKRLEDAINKVLLNEYKFVGHGEVVIAGKCPDFININGQKKIIELYGNYWHQGQDPQDRINLFKEYGYETLVIWEHELKNMEVLKEKIIEFHERSQKYVSESQAC